MTDPSGVGALGRTGAPKDLYREQLRKHIAAIDGRRPQDGHSERGFSICPHPDCRTAQSMTRLPLAPTMADAAEMLWVVLANVSGGDWTKQSPEWQEAAARWRDNYFAALRVVAPQQEQEIEPITAGEIRTGLLDTFAIHKDDLFYRLKARAAAVDPPPDCVHQWVEYGRRGHGDVWCVKCGIDQRAAVDPPPDKEPKR